MKFRWHQVRLLRVGCEHGFSVVEEEITSPDIALDSSVDLVFVALHGSFGEDGNVQQQLLDLAIPFTGSSVVSCENSFDKVKTRSILRELGVPVAAGEVLQSATSGRFPTSRGKASKRRFEYGLPYGAQRKRVVGCFRRCGFIL